MTMAAVLIVGAIVTYLAHRYERLVEYNEAFRLDAKRWNDIGYWVRVDRERRWRLSPWRVVKISAYTDRLAPYPRFVVTLDDVIQRKSQDEPTPR